jgi:hypothetical protein
MLAELPWRRIILIGGGSLIVIAILIWLFGYLTTGKVVITTDARPNVMTLTRVGSIGSDEGEQVSPVITTTHDKLSARVKPGQYIAAVTGNSIGSTKLVTVTARHTVRYTINPINPTGVAPVSYAQAQNLAASGQSLVYLDAASGYIKKIDAGNNTSVVGQHYPLQSVAWASPSLGVAQDTQNQLYVVDVDGNNITPLNVPFQYSKDAVVSYAIAPNGHIYISQGSAVYSGTRDGNFKKIYTAETGNPTLTAGPGKVLVNDNPGEGSKQEASIVVVTDSGKVTHGEFETSLAAWSPDGKHVAAATETSAAILGSSLEMVKPLPTNTFVSRFAWLDNETLFYSSNDQLWTYNIDTQDTKLLANMPLGQGVTGLTISSDKAYIYMVTASTSSESDTAIRRIGLQNQPVPKYMFRLQDIMPNRQNSYLMTLTAFSDPPTILVQPFKSNDPKDYAGLASQALSSSGFDTAQFKFKVVQPSLPGQQTDF